MSLVTGLVPIDEVVYFDICTHNPSTGAISDADTTPTFDVYEEATDTGMLGATNFTKRTSLTGNYRGTFTASAANGFEAGKWYSVIASATVNSIAAKKNCGSFRAAPAEQAAGVPEVDVKAINNIATSPVTTVKAVQGLTTADSIAALTTAAVDNVLDRTAGVETNFTLRQALRLILSAASAKLSGAATATVKLRDINDTKDRITATVDADGNRTAVTTDVT